MGREIFNFVQRPKLRKSVLDLSYQNVFTCKMGELVPCYIEEVLPSDKLRLTAAPFVRAMPLSAPIMGQVDVSMWYFFVPFHIIWDDFEEFITGGQDGLKKPVMPYFDKASNARSSYDPKLFDMLRFESSVKRGVDYIRNRPVVNALPWRSYWKIVNDYFRDQNLQPDIFDDTSSSFLNTGSGLVTSLPGYSDLFFGRNNDQCFMKAWAKDQFTSALPFAQRGAPVSIPVSGGQVYWDSTEGQYDLTAIPNAGAEPSNPLLDIMAEGSQSVGSQASGPIKVRTDLSAGFNINDLREASAIQRFLEFNAIGGSRYIEQVATHFGTRVGDYRLNRPEFICGMKTPVLSSQVLQTSETNSTSALGTQGGTLMASGVMKPRKYSFHEHGLVIGLMAITPRSTYSQGVSRFALKRDKFDFFFPYFEDLGEQEIYNAELYTDGTDADMQSFGYGPRYYEYKNHENEVHGRFKDELAYWIPQRIFSSRPALNPDFISVNPEKEQSLNNIFAVTDSDQDQFYCLVQNSARYIRPMAKYSKFLLR